MYLAGNRVINVEPSGLCLQYQKNWETVSLLDQVLDKVDFVYASHSLEHVQDIDKFLRQVKKILQPDGYVFWEVPNFPCPQGRGEVIRFLGKNLQ